MLLRQALRPGSSLLAEVRHGLDAVERKHVRLIVPSDRSLVGDSLNLDEATRRQHPNDHRWDYIISILGVVQIVGVEPHSIKDSEIKRVISKKRSAEEVLRSEFQPGYRVAKWFWVSDKSVHFSKMEPTRRLLDMNGITFKKAPLHLTGC